MGTTERKERDKLKLKDKILKSAKDLLLKNGHDALSIRKIAEKIEYSPATIYLYFKDKDEILHDLMEIGFQNLKKYMVGATEEKDPLKRLHIIGNEYIRFGLEQKDWYELMFNSIKPMQHIEKCREDWGEGQQVFEFLTQACAEAIQLLKLQNIEPQIFALQLWSTVHGLVNLANTDRLMIVDAAGHPALIKKTMDALFYTIMRQ